MIQWWQAWECKWLIAPFSPGSFEASSEVGNKICSSMMHIWEYIKQKDPQEEWLNLEPIEYPQFLCQRKLLQESFMCKLLNITWCVTLEDLYVQYCPYSSGLQYFDIANKPGLITEQGTGKLYWTIAPKVVEKTEYLRYMGCSHHWGGIMVNRSCNGQLRHEYCCQRNIKKTAWMRSREKLLCDWLVEQWRNHGQASRNQHEYLWDWDLSLNSDWVPSWLQMPL